MNPIISTISLLGVNFAPQGWALCNGALLSIAQNQALFATIGTTYGGNGETDFALPNLAPLHCEDQPASVNYYIRIQ